MSTLTFTIAIEWVMGRKSQTEGAIYNRAGLVMRRTLEIGRLIMNGLSREADVDGLMAETSDDIFQAGELREGAGRVEMIINK